MQTQRVQKPASISAMVWQRATPDQDQLQTNNSVLAAQPDPFAQVTCRLGNNSCAQAHAAKLNGEVNNRRGLISTSLLRLQQQYGNRYVNQVVALRRAANIGPKRECACTLESTEDKRKDNCPTRATYEAGLENDEGIEGETSEVMRMAPARLAQDDLPHNGSATIVCNGRGGYRVSMGSWAGATCGIAGCVRRHEESHIADWQGRWPDGCKNADGTPKPDGSTIPLGGPGYNTFLRQSECTAYGVEERCVQGLLRNASEGCRATLRSHLTDTQNRKNGYCS